MCRILLNYDIVECNRLKGLLVLFSQEDCCCGGIIGHKFVPPAPDSSLDWRTACVLETASGASY